MNNNTPSLHEIIKNSYSKKKNPQMGGFEYDAQLSNHNQQVYYHPKQKKLIYTIAGTHNLSDVGTDAYLAAGHLKDTNRYKEAKSTLDKAKSKYNVNNATIAGHSLGGSIAGYVGSKGDNVFTLDKGATIGQKVKKAKMLIEVVEI